MREPAKTDLLRLWLVQRQALDLWAHFCSSEQGLLSCRNWALPNSAGDKLVEGLEGPVDLHPQL